MVTFPNILIPGAGATRQQIMTHWWSPNIADDNRGLLRSLDPARPPGPV
jgi:hypothetical protein